MQQSNDSLKVGIISQARMTSTRLPGKVLKSVADKPLIKYHVDRLSKSNIPIYIATTSNQSDLPLVQFCQENQIPYFCGSEEDVLARYFLAAEKYGLDVIIRVTSDCPLIDGELIAEGLVKYVERIPTHKNLYLSNCLQRTYPRGFDFEIFSFASLHEAYQFATLSSDREHVTPYLHQNRNKKMEFLSMTRSEDASQFRITVDELADFQLIKILIEQHNAHLLNSDQICDLLKRHPELVKINSNIEQKKL